MSNRRILEVCVASVEDAIAAEQAGADRLELNLALELGGLTPSAGLLETVVAAIQIPVIAMVRPRAAGFCYSDTERIQMLRDAEVLLELGAAGIASGALTPDRVIDQPFWREMARLVDEKEVVFHRAFDLIADQAAAIDQLIDLGTNRILTSGGRESACAGAAQIARWRPRAEPHLKLLPGSGITAENIPRLIEQTGCDQVHGSFSDARVDPAGSVAPDRFPATSFERVAAARSALDAAPRACG